MGLLFSKTWNPKTDMPDLQGKVALVTGGNAGIGYATVKCLALKGAKVYLGARSESRATKAIEGLYEEYPDLRKGLVEWLPLDLADLKSVSQAAQKLMKREDRLDIIINNAAILPNAFELTDAGFESGIGITHVGHFALVNGLLPLLESTARQEGSDVRVVTISSEANSFFVPKDYNFDFSSPSGLASPGTSDPAKYTAFFVMMLRYGVAKLANILFASEFQRRCDNKNIPIISVSVHPGSVASEGVLGKAPSFLEPLLRMFLSTTVTGATTGLWAATATEVKSKPDEWKGKYIIPYGKLGKPHVATKDPQLAKDLWETTSLAIEKYQVKIAAQPE